MIVALFEDESYRNFFPIAYTRPVFELRSGMLSFFERTQRAFTENRTLLFTREHLAPTLRKRVSSPVNQPHLIDDDVLFVNGTLVVNEEAERLVEKGPEKNALVKQRDRIALAHLSERAAKNLGDDFCGIPNSSLLKKLEKECKVLETANLSLLTYPWDLIDSNPQLIIEDFQALGRKESKGTMDKEVRVYGDEADLYVGEASLIEAYVTLDARKGPIYIGDETLVHSGSRISGPAYIGDGSIVATALIREGCSIGDVCRVGGELDKTVIQGYTNKQHNGYMGHAYVGEWVNIGAATNNSDLKNTYGTVRVTVEGGSLDTGQIKVGCFIGDHAKTSIGTQIYAGKKIGVASHVHGFVTEDVPSFTMWAKSLGLQPVELLLQSATETQRRVMARRGVEQTKEDVELLKKVFEITAEEREKKGVVKRKFEL